MSEYKIKSSYFSAKNKVILLICVFFFSCSTHIFKNVFPFLFMLTSSHENNSNNSNEYNVRANINSNQTSKIYKQQNNDNAPNYTHRNYNYDDKYPEILQDRSHIDSSDMLRQNSDDQNSYEKFYKINMSNTYNNDSSRFNNHSIYLYSNALSLIYISSLVTYIFILFFDLSKKKYILSSLYIINLISHCIIFLILNSIQINNTNLPNNSHTYKHMNIINGGHALQEKDYYELKREEINLFFHNNLKNNFGHTYVDNSVSLSYYSDIMDRSCLYSNMDETKIKNDINNGIKNDINNDIKNANHFSLLYLFIIISSVCSAYIKIYQKNILYCIFYLNLGFITSLLILMNSIFKIMAHSLNYIMSNNNTNINISDYILMFSFIDTFGLFTIFLFSYKWSNQNKLWINLSTIFYNYKYTCFYINETYYLYSTDKDIDNIIAQIDMCKDPNVDITFSAYTNIEKSIFYDFFLKNKNNENKLNIIEIKDKNFKITTTYNTKNVRHNENDKPIFEDVENAENADVTPSYNRKNKHSHTIKPYKIHVETINKNLLEDMENLTNREKEEDTQIVINKSDSNNNVIPYVENNNISIPSINNSLIKDNTHPNYESINNKNDIFDLPCEKSIITDQKINDVYLFNDSNIKDKIGGVKNGNKINKNSLNIHRETHINFEINPSINNNSNKNSSDLITNIKCKQPMIEDEFEKPINIPEEEIDEKKNSLLVPDHNEDNKYIDYENYELSYKNYNSPLFIKRDKEIDNIQNDFIIFQYIKTIFSSFTYYFYFFIFIYAFLLSIMHIFVNYFFYIYLFVFNINIYISNIYTIIMTFVSLIAIPFSGYIIDNIGSFLFLLLCSSFFILIAISGTIYCCIFNLRSEAIAFISFNLIGISESIIPTVIISQIPTHLCVKKNEDITAAFAIFELVSMLIVSINNYIFGYFLINKEYLNGLYILFVFVVLVISLIFLLIFTMYLKAKPNSKYISTNNTDITQPLL
ncbi:conserved Plasmodium membrane protein, unknown function [Plasmodium chabaudi chabaudi]|uniref:Major facilitator superfamily domain-containing protein n=1 Tax=Plasmodium chabaudi chabaudi TaxID=31271 RepID=A0A4V0K6W5_PLACU|nr:conserved Plasmodium membrane protein, unknown function [Plasmodium chabaudi chabaudi]VTZ68741.1 conserved Plasmodium membrane protein, unknown function [Plasmodium chabaudi chabaudi]|eukprot:XP_016655348.1 conserved Plasmodium membrane protein, unknown function [Plasmodium chabaudi chabaudi]